ncbi:MAG TPA: sugar ABC transporter permease [Firmicutes bacterium]|jgi:multiple sugar transport system permease protein|nr:sugar ABC transporter permease [Bacillota bacterium]HBK61650.1 sugar ABC transporter permease [Bacillota bacterium]
MRNLTKALGYILLTIAALTFIYPFLWMASASLKPENEIGTLALISRNFSLRGYSAVFKQIPIGRALFNSGFVSITSTASVLVLSSMVGYALARLRFVGRDSIFNLVLLTMMIPGQLLLIPMYILVVRLGWTDSYRALIIPALISNMGIIVFRQFFKSLPQDLVDAARIDGCSDYRILFQIFWPLSKPVLITVGIITFIGSWNEVLWPLIVIRRWSMMTMPQMVTLFHVGGLAGAQVAAEMAAAMMLALPVIVAYLFFQRYFIESLALSGIKG